ncbi:hypothetical protein [Actinoplanes derwentensis]|uniref:Uncharacterized protein n=1 Tax=Actinoplanes derwentensis TaxID=113562 RepID=A0A1H2CVV0_9ACTN|nr:hypothetical protein [Actinoplanes derwentensis]GID82058.1 hypothetical protein Ade03nite_09820 [Actinoplanes derwentensis]SDT74504.1 hypothetical protein SAMN04489716_7002 [Actinoplanes derwentensis]
MLLSDTILQPRSRHTGKPRRLATPVTGNALLAGLTTPSYLGTGIDRAGRPGCSDQPATPTKGIP